MKASASVLAPSVFVLSLLLTTSTLVAASSDLDRNWPQWRGPHQDGVAPDANPPVTWSETNHVKWKVKIPGEGNSTPIVWGNKVFVQTAAPTGKKAEPVATSESAAPSRPERSQGDSGPPGVGPGGGPGGFGPGNILSDRVLADGDANKDGK